MHIFTAIVSKTQARCISTLRCPCLSLVSNCKSTRCFWRSNFSQIHFQCQALIFSNYSPTAELRNVTFGKTTSQRGKLGRLAALKSSLTLTFIFKVECKKFSFCNNSILNGWTQTRLLACVLAVDKTLNAVKL